MLLLLLLLPLNWSLKKQKQKLKLNKQLTKKKSSFSSTSSLDTWNCVMRFRPVYKAKDKVYSIFTFASNSFSLLKNKTNKQNVLNSFKFDLQFKLNEQWKQIQQHQQYIAMQPFYLSLSISYGLTNCNLCRI